MGCFNCGGGQFCGILPPMSICHSTNFIRAGKITVSQSSILGAREEIISVITTFIIRVATVCLNVRNYFLRSFFMSRKGISSIVNFNFIFLMKLFTHVKYADLRIFLLSDFKKSLFINPTSMRKKSWTFFPLTPVKNIDYESGGWLILRNEFSVRNGWEKSTIFPVHRGRRSTSKQLGRKKLAKQLERKKIWSITITSK